MTSLVDNYMGLLPLWSGIMLTELKSYGKENTTATQHKTVRITRDSNSPIENYFGNIKSGLRPRQIYRVSSFISLHQNMLTGLLKEIKTYNPNIVCPRTMDTTTKKPDVEKWKRVNKRSQSYHKTHEKCQCQKRKC